MLRLLLLLVAFTTREGVIGSSLWDGGDDRRQLTCLTSSSAMVPCPAMVSQLSLDSATANPVRAATAAHASRLQEANTAPSETEQHVAPVPL